MNKRGYMKTVEAVVALILVLAVIVTIINRNQEEIGATTPREIKIAQDTINNMVQNDEDLRRAVLLNQSGVLQTELDEYFQNYETLTYNFTICDTAYCPSLEGLPKDKSIYVSNLIISSVHNETGHGVFKLYLWRKVE